MIRLLNILINKLTNLRDRLKGKDRISQEEWVKGYRRWKGRINNN